MSTEKQAVARPAAEAASTAPGLSDLARVPLGAVQEALLRDLCAESLGPTPWRRRKEQEARQLLALERIAPRLTVQSLDLRTSLKALVHLRMPVPCLPRGGEETAVPGTGVGAEATMAGSSSAAEGSTGAAASGLVVGDRVVLALHYPEVLLHQAIPGTLPVVILFPRGVHHPNVAPGDAPVQLLCLGPRVARGTPLRELVLASYAALSLQAVTIAEDDPAGVLNPGACRWWQARRDLIPLTREPFLAAPEPSPGSAPESARASQPRGGRP